VNRSSTSRAQLANAKVEIVAKTRNAIVAQIVIRWPTSTVTNVFLAAWLAGLSGMPATWSATAAAAASTSAMIARKGRLGDFLLATAQRYRQARWSHWGTSAPTSPAYIFMSGPPTAKTVLPLRP